MPIEIPGLAAVGAIKRLISIPCAIEPLILAEAFSTALLWVIRSNWEPSWKQEWKWASGGKSWVCNVKEAVGDSAGVHAMEKGSFRRFAFKFAENADKAMRWWWLASMADEGLVDFSTLAIRYSQCNEDDRLFSATGTPWVSAFPLNGEWGTLDWWLGFQPGGPAHDSEVAVPRGFTGVIYCNVSPVHLIYGPISAQTRIVDITGQRVLDRSASEPDGKGGYLPIINWATMGNDQFTPKRMRWEISSTDDPGWPHEGFHGKGDSCFLYPLGA